MNGIMITCPNCHKAFDSIGEGPADAKYKVSICEFCGEIISTDDGENFHIMSARELTTTLPMEQIAEVSHFSKIINRMRKRKKREEAEQTELSE